MLLIQNTLIILISSFFISFQKSLNFENFFSEKNNQTSNYTNLKEWISQLVIALPNELLQNITQGLLEDVTIYGIGLDNIQTTNQVILENKVGLNISVVNAHINISGLFTLLFIDKTFNAHISNLNLLLPFYLIRDPETGLVSGVDTNGLIIDFDNLVIELEVDIAEIFKDILMTILREVLLSLESYVIEPRLVELLNTKVGGLFLKANDMILNGTQPKSLNITLKEEDILDLKKSTLISSIAYLLNHIIGTEGPLNLNYIVNIFTNDIGVFRLHEFYNDNINLTFDIKDKNSNSFGNVEISLDDLNISGLNTWKNFSVFEPYNKFLLYSFTSLKELTINASFSLKLDVDNSTYFSTNNTILYEKIFFSTNLVNNTLKSFLKLAVNNKKLNYYTNQECLDLDCVLDLSDANGTGITALALNEIFTYILLEFDKKSSLEEDLDYFIDKFSKLFITNFGDKIPLFLNAILNTTVIDFVNGKINDYLYKNYCPGISDPEHSEINILSTSIAFPLAFCFFLVIIFYPYILGKACRKQNYKEKKTLIEVDEEINRVSKSVEINNKENIEIQAEYYFPNISVKWLKEFGRKDPAGASLFLHPEISIFWRVFIPFGIFATCALFFSSISSTRASIYGVIEVGRRIEIPIFHFTFYTSLEYMWNSRIFITFFLFGFFTIIWPFLKLILLLINFILPASLLNKRIRGILLMILDATQKWTIFDTYKMITLFIAFHFQFAFPVAEPSEAVEGSKLDLFAFDAYGFHALVIGTIISLLLSHIVTHLHRGLDEHPDQNKGQKAESYKALISFAQNKYLGKAFFRIAITILLFLTLILIIIGSNITVFSFYFDGLAGYCQDLFGISRNLEYSLIELGLNFPEANINKNQGLLRVTQFIYFLTLLVIPIATLVNLIFLWLIPLPRKTQKIFYVTAEILNAWSCLDVFVICIIVSIKELGQFIQFIISDKFGQIELFVEKYFYKILDGHNTIYEMRANSKNGCWILFAAAIVFFISSNVVLKVCRDALDERLPDNAKEYLKNKNEGKRKGLINDITNRDNSNSNVNEVHKYGIN